MQKYFVFDVESLGLHGIVFAYGYVVVDETGRELESGYEACSSFTKFHNWSKDSADFDPFSDDIKWTVENVLPALNGSTCDRFPELRDRFWKAWVKWKEQGAIMCADCPYPVEYNFVSECLAEAEYSDRAHDAPYPFIDVASVLLTAGENPIGEFNRLENELPRHNPLCDARQSARLLIEAIDAINAPLI